MAYIFVNIFVIGLLTSYVKTVLPGYLDGTPNLGYSLMGLGLVRLLSKALMGLKISIKEEDRIVSKQ